MKLQDAMHEFTFHPSRPTSGASMTPVQEHIAAVADKVTIAGSAGSVVGWLSSSAFGMWAGIVIGLAGLFVNWYFKRKGDRRQEAAHRAFLHKLSSGDTPLQSLDRLEADE